MSKRGIIFVILLVIILSSSQVFAVAKISVDKDIIIPGGNVEIKIRPDSAGVYKELYLIDKQGKIFDRIILDCDTVCYEDKTTVYSLPPTMQPGDYKIYVYDYSINNYIIYEFKVVQSQQPARTLPSKNVSKYFVVGNIHQEGNDELVIKTKENIQNLKILGAKMLDVQNDTLIFFPKTDSTLIFSNLNDVNSAKLIEYNSNQYIVELEDEPNIEYQTNLKNEINYYSSKVSSLENANDRNFIINLVNKVKLIYYNYRLENKQSNFRDKIKSHSNSLKSDHESVKSKIKSIQDTVIINEFKNSYNGIVVKGSSINELRKIKGVKSVKRDFVVKALLNTTVPLIGAPSLWNIGYSGNGTKIAIIDTGVDYTHPDLGGCFGPGCKVADGYDFVNKDNDPMDDQGHGTHVAATAAGNGLFKGVAPDANIYAYKVLDSYGSGFTSTIVAGIERATDPNNDNNFTDHVDVISMSLGGWGTPDDPMAIAVDNAVDAGVVAVIAAGNSGPFDQTIGSPGTSRKAITIGASTRLDQMAYFSSRGPIINGDELLIKPDVTAPGVLICAAQWDSAWNSSRCYQDIPNHIAISGTSMATPHVAGVAALLKQAHPTWTPEIIKSAIMLTAKDMGYDPFIQGSGRVDAFQAYNSSISVDKPSLSFNNIQNNVTVTKFTIKNLRDYAIFLTLNSTNASKKYDNLSYNVLSLNTSSILLNPGESKSITAVLTIPPVTGLSSGTISINENGRLYRMPYAFIALSRIKLKAISSGKILSPTFLVADESFRNAFAAQSGFHFDGDELTFTVDPGDYVVYAIGDNSDPELEYILMNKITVPPLSTVNLVLSTKNARQFKVNTHSKSAKPLLLETYLKDVILTTSAGSIYYSQGYYGFFFYSPDRTVYISDIADDSKFDNDISISYNGIPSQDPARKQFREDAATTSNEQYDISWYLDKVDSSTPSTFDYSDLDLAKYNFTFDYPSTDPANFKVLSFNIPPYAWFSIGYRRDIAVPLNRIYYIMNQIPTPNKFQRNWSFSSNVLVNYMISSDPLEQDVYNILSGEYYKSLDFFNALNPRPGDKDIIYYGKTPLTPAQVKIEGDRIKLNGFLAKGFKGKSTLYKEEALSFNPYKFYNLNPPTYFIYQDGTLVSSGNITKRGSYGLTYWYPGVLNYTLSSGINVVNITVPIGYLVWNKTITTATIGYPSPDIQPPIINSVLASPRFSENSVPIVSLNITDDISLNNITLYYRYDDSNWIDIPVSFPEPPIGSPVSNELFIGLLPSTPQGTNKIDLKITATDSAGNKNELQILPASLPARTINLTRYLTNPNPLPGQEINISGYCKDNLGFNCTNIRLIHYLNGNQYYVDKTHRPYLFYKVYNYGQYIFNWIAEPFVQPNFTTVFEGTGLYKPYGSPLTQLSVASAQNDIGIKDLRLTGLVFNQQGGAYFTLYNSGNSTELNIPVSLKINSTSYASQIIPQLNAGSQLSINLTFVPTQTKNSLVSLTVDRQDSNLYNNELNKSVYIDFLLPDIQVTALVNSNPPFLYGTKINRTMNIYNVGKFDANNTIFSEFIIDNSLSNTAKFTTSYGISNTSQFKNTNYTILPYYTNSTHVSMTISSPGFSQSIALYHNDLYILPDNTLLVVSAFPTSLTYTLASPYYLISKTIDLPSINVTLFIRNLTLSQIGLYTIYGKISPPLDVNKQDNIYSLTINSLPLAPDLKTSLSLYLSSIRLISINRTNTFQIFVSNAGGAQANDTSFNLYLNNTLTNSSFIGILPVLSNSFKTIKLTPGILGKVNLSAVAYTTGEFNPKDNIATQIYTAIQTKNSLFTVKNITNSYPGVAVFNPLSTIFFGKFVSTPTNIELPYHTPFLLGLRRGKVYPGYPTYSLLLFTVYYTNTLSKDEMNDLIGIYENITDDNKFLYYTFANRPDWQYNNTKYNVAITNVLTTYLSSSDVYGCSNWDFSGIHCISSWQKLDGLRQFVYGFSTNLIMNGSTSSMEAYAIGYDLASTSTIYQVGGGGGGSSYSSSGSSGGSSSKYNLYTDLIYYKLIAPSSPFQAFTKNTLIDISRIGLSTTEQYSNDYIAITEYFYPPADLLPNSRLVYSFFDVDHIQIPRQSILSSNITFRVPISWLATYSLNPESIILQRYTGSLWQDLVTNLTYFDSDYYYYTAQTPGLSTFAITYNLPEFQPLASEFTTTSISTQQPASIIQQQQPVIGSINKLFYIVPAIFIVLALILFSIGRRKKKKPVKILLKSIENARKQGFSNEAIVKEATEQGWPEDLIRQLLNKPKF